MLRLYRRYSQWVAINWGFLCENLRTRRAAWGRWIGWSEKFSNQLWRGESGGSLTFRDDFVVIEHGGLEIKEPYELSPSFIKVMAKPGLMGALLIPYHQDGDRLILEPGGPTEKVYERVR